MTNSDYDIETSEFGGQRLILCGSLNALRLKEVALENVDSLTLRRSFGWSDTELNILELLPNIKELVLYADDITDISKIDLLNKLEVLYLKCPKARVVPDFSNFRNLKEFAADWKDNFDSILANESVTRMRLDKFKCANLQSLKGMTHLNDLELVGGNIESLSGIECLKALKRLMLYQCRKLYSVKDIQKHKQLIKLDIESCKKISDLEAVTKVTSLELLVLEKCAGMKTIKGVEKMLNLEKLRIVDTAVIDGDMSGLFGLRDKDLFFTNKKHYSHKLSQIRGRPDYD